MQIGVCPSVIPLVGDVDVYLKRVHDSTHFQVVDLITVFNDLMSSGYPASSSVLRWSWPLLATSPRTGFVVRAVCGITSKRNKSHHLFRSLSLLKPLSFPMPFSSLVFFVNCNDFIQEYVLVSQSCVSWGCFFVFCFLFVSLVSDQIIFSLTVHWDVLQLEFSRHFVNDSFNI